jgi:glycosyltransferase involved in cell wall biosynthesis
MKQQVLKPDVWVVVDNSSDPSADWSVSTGDPTVLYEHIDGEQTIAQLRNRCLELALANGADMIAFWDDDDYYPPTRIWTGVRALEDNPDADMSGTSEMYMLLTRENVLMSTGPFGPTHATAATWTIRRKYAETHRFDPTKTRAEEPTFTNQWTAKMIQVPAEDMIVVMGHSKNTVDKSDVLKRPQVYSAKILNSDNGKQVVRSRWPVPWGLFRTTFSV